MSLRQTSVVFAYSEVGVRCLSVLLQADLEVSLVITHKDDPNETQWFTSVAELAGRYAIPVLRPRDVNRSEVVRQIESLHPDWIFSFFYRQLLGPRILGSAQRGALNMHGSLLPRYRGRAPINWAVLHGESETGASLHEMIEKPDAGALIDQQSVPILANDHAIDVARKVAVAAEIVLWRSLPRLLSGDFNRQALDLRQGSYFGGRRPEDGRIDWRADAWSIHNLIRAVAPPYPGAFFVAAGHHIRLLDSFFLDQPARGDVPRLYFEDACLHADCHGGKRLSLPSATLDGKALDAELFGSSFGAELLM